jgi:PEP-CTERM motif
MHAMKKILPALAVALIAGMGASSAAQAAVIDFTFAAIGGKVTATPTPLQDATTLDLDGASLIVTGIGTGDASGLHVPPPFDASAFVTLTSPILFTSTGPLVSDITKEWTDGLGTFTEILTTIKQIDRDATNAITVTLTGTLNGPGFVGTPVDLIIDATQSGGPGNRISVSGSNSSVVPEPATWVMMGLGFIGLGYAAVRRNSKDRSAVAMI